MDADDVRKNFYLYRDTNGTQQWSIFPWDKDWTFGVRGDGGTHLEHPFFGDYAHRKQNANQWNVLYDTVFNDPVLREMYLRRLRTVMDELLQPPGTSAETAYFEQTVDELYAKSAAELPTSVANQVRSLKAFFPNRRETLYVDHSIDKLSPGETFELIPEFAPSVQYFVPIDNDLETSWTAVEPPESIDSWSVGQAGIGFGTRDSFLDLIRTTVVPADSCAQCTSVYMRIPFQVENPAEINVLTLRMKYDDGFIAYINGEEIARARYEGEPTFDARARSRSNTAAVVFENHALDVPPGLLLQGENILSIHGINSSSTSSDMLMMPMLISGIVGDENAAGIPHAQVKNPMIQFGAFDQDPETGDQDQEFIELVNQNNTAVDISGWQLTGGIQHAFPAGTVIPANGSMFVPPSVPAFLSRPSGPSGDQGLFVQGNYVGHLSNFGETVELIAADGTTIDSFTTLTSPSDPQRFLRISELHYHPPGEGDQTEYIELTNISQGPQAVVLDLGGVTISNGLSEPFRFVEGTTLEPGQHRLVVKNREAFQAAYPDVDTELIAGVFVGSLRNGGELLRMDDARGNTVLAFEYDDSPIWPQSPDGAGSSLELIDPVSTLVDQLGKSYVWQSSTEWGGSPGRAGQGPLGIQINEIVAGRTVTETEGDAIELWNSTAVAVNIGGWYLSDSAADLLKYRIPEGTTLLPGKYVVFDESDFNSVAAGDRAFALSATEGDDVWLSIANEAGQVIAIVDDVHFGPSKANESYGRSAESPGRFIPFRQPSLGRANTAARVGPVVISEVHYHPAAPSAAALAMDPALDAEELEFVEVLNPTSETVDLSQWRLRGGVDFDFPEGTLLDGGETILVISFDPDRADNAARRQAFLTHFGLSSDARLIGGLSGQLGNGQDRVQLQRHTLSVEQQAVYLWEDEIFYDDQAPWPMDADGQGESLQRISQNLLGSAFGSWIAASPNPGGHALTTGDLNGDALVNAGDIDYLCARLGQPDPTSDLDRDGTVSRLDLEILVRRLLRTDFGDANLDGVFDSADFVHVFQTSEYEDSIVGNSTWSDGDWDCDGDFTTLDLVLAFQSGSYEDAAPRAATATGPIAAIGATRDNDGNPLRLQASKHAMSQEGIDHCASHAAALQQFLDSWAERTTIFDEDRTTELPSPVDLSNDLRLGPIEQAISRQ